MAKIDWAMNDTVMPADMNQMGEEINAATDLAASAMETATVALGATTVAVEELSAATSAAMPDRLAKRDSDGRMKVAAPAAAEDVARKAEVDAVAADKVSKTGDTMTGYLTVLGAVSASLSSNGSKRVGIGYAESADEGQVLSIDAVGPEFKPVSLVGSDAIFRLNGGTAQRLWHDGRLRVSGGKLQFLDGGTWRNVGGTSVIDMSYRRISHVVISDTSIPALGSLDLFTYSGSGVIGEFAISLGLAVASGSPTNSSIGFSIVIDGVDHPITIINSNVFIGARYAGTYQNNVGISSVQGIYVFNNIVKFNTSFIIKAKNGHSSTTYPLSANTSITGGYYI